MKASWPVLRFSFIFLNACLQGTGGQNVASQPADQGDLQVQPVASQPAEQVDLQLPQITLVDDLELQVAARANDAREWILVENKVKGVDIDLRCQTHLGASYTEYEPLTNDDVRQVIDYLHNNLRRGNVWIKSKYDSRIDVLSRAFSWQSETVDDSLWFTSSEVTYEPDDDDELCTVLRENYPLLPNRHIPGDSGKHELGNKDCARTVAKYLCVGQAESTTLSSTIPWWSSSSLASTSTFAWIPFEEPETTASVDEPETTTSVDEPETTTSIDEPETTTSAEEQETTTSAEDPVTSTSIDESEGAASGEEPETTTSAEEPETTTSVDEPETTTSVDESEGAASGEEPETTTSVEDPVTTTSAEEQETTTSVDEPETTTSVNESEGAGSGEEPETTTSVEDPVTTTSAEEQETTTSINEPETTTSADESETTTSADESEFAASGEEPETTTSAEDPLTTTSAEEQETTTSDDELVTSTTSRSVEEPESITDTSPSVINRDTTSPNAEIDARTLEESQTLSSTPVNERTSPAIFEHTKPKINTPRQHRERQFVPVKVCPCKCPNNTKIVRNVSAEVEHKLTTELQQNLTVASGDLSQTVRKKISARDDRPSSQIGGYIAISLLTFTFGALVSLDILNACSYLSSALMKEG